jgi:hypothetical protein
VNQCDPKLAIGKSQHSYQQLNKHGELVPLTTATLSTCFFFEYARALRIIALRRERVQKQRGHRPKKGKKLKQPKEETPEQTKDPATLAWTLLSRHQQLQILCPCPHPQIGISSDDQEQFRHRGSSLSEAPRIPFLP